MSLFARPPRKPLISVIIPMFGAGPFIGRCLESLRTQAFDSWEAVVIDDGSTDDGPEVVRRVAELDRRVRLVRQRNAGLPAARNAGIETARGDWLRFLDADDWVTVDGLRALLDIAVAESASLVCGGASYHDQHGGPLGWSFRPGAARVSLPMLVEAHRFQVSAAMVRRGALGDLRFRDWAQGSEDLDLWLRLSEAGRDWNATDVDVAAYRLRPSGMSRDHAMMGAVAGRVIEECFERTPALEAGEPGKRDRCLRRIAMERATASAWRSTRDGEPAVALWRRLRPAPPTPVTPEEAASAGLWSLPYADCMPPLAWREDQRAAAYAGRLAAFWGELEAGGEALQGFVGAAVCRLAALLVEPREMAGEIERRVVASGAGTVVVHGLGRNAAAVVPILAATGLRVLGCDDALNEGERPLVGGERVEVVRPGGWPKDSAHLVAPSNPGPIARRLEGLHHVLEWNDIASVLAGRQHERLLRLWPTPVRACAAGVAA